MDLRNMAFNIGWNINDSPLIQANALTDAFRDDVISITDDMEVFGDISELTANQISDGMREAQEQMHILGDTSETAMNQVSEGMQEAQDGIKEMGEQTRRTTEAMSTDLEGVNSSLRDMMSSVQGAFGALKAGLGVLAAGGTLGFFAGAASEAEATQVRFEWFASKTEDDFATINQAIQETIDLTQGLFTEGELQQAFMSANVGADFFAEFSESAAIAAIKTGTGFDQMLSLFSRSIESGAIGPLIELGVITEETFEAIGEKMTTNIKDWNEHRKEMLLQIGTQEFFNNNIKDMNEYLKTTEARINIFKGHWGDIKEIMGAPMLQPMNQFLSLLSSLFAAIKDNPLGQFALKAAGWVTGIIALGVAFMSVTTAIRALLPVIVPLIAPFAKFLLIGTAIYLIVEDLIYAFFGLGDSVTESLFNATMEFLGFEYTFQDLREDIINGLQAIGDFFVLVWDWIKAAWGEGEGWLADVVFGIGSMLEGLITWSANVFKMGIGMIMGIVTGDWSMVSDAFQGIVDSGEKIWDGLKLIVAKPLDWVTEKFGEWKDKGLELIDDLIQGFLNMPDTIMSGLSSFGTQLKDKFTEMLGGVRRLLPFSPAKEGPLMDLHESGTNIIGNIQEGINLAEELSIQHKLAPAAKQAEEPMPLSLPTLGGGGDISVSAPISITISMSGNNMDIEEQVNRAKQEVEKQFPSMLEEVFRRMRSKSPWTTEN